MRSSMTHYAFNHCYFFTGAKISSVPIQEINHNERVFLEMIDYKLHVELDAFNIWSIRLRKLIEEKRLNAQARTASKEPILAPTAQLSLTLSSDQITSTKLEGSRESLPSSQASSTASLTRRPTISRPVDRLASSPVTTVLQYCL
ncbi:hypothetical protein BY996DRAFT_3869631 [Phakopsora pachyrhizi]|nr:hypothetical protein BY996DRAFT_3869631 [Phakopsora pachyrhizi]